MSNNYLLQNNIMKRIFFSLIENQKWNTLVELIENQQLDINYRDEKGRNALFWAIHCCNTKAIQELLKLGIDTYVTPNLTAMNYAVYKDNVKIIKCLKNCGLDINQTDDIHSTALIYAVLFNKLNSINYLVDNGADIFQEDFLGNSAYSLAFDLKIKYLMDKFSKSSK